MDDEPRPSLKAIGAALGVMVVVLVGGLFLMGGQVSTILSNVGNSITAGNDVGTGVGGEPPAEEPPADEGGGEIADAAARPPELLIIRTGELEIEVTNLAAAVSAARTRVVALGGYVSASDEIASGENARATSVYRIPADRWDEALEGIRGVAAEIHGQQVETEAVTSQVVDLGARISNLRASEAALQKIMAQATKISDVLDVQAELTKVRGEIEQLVAQKAQLEERAAFGTLTVVFLLPTTPATVEAQRGWDPAVDADRATGTLIGVGQGAASLAIWLGIVGLPLGLVGLIAVVIVARVARFVTRHGAAEAGTS
jgi:hypothetical protein